MKIQFCPICHKPVMPARNMINMLKNVKTEGKGGITLTCGNVNNVIKNGRYIQVKCKGKVKFKPEPKEEVLEDVQPNKE